MEKEINDFNKIKYLVRVLLYISIFSLSISLITTFVYGTIDSYSINYFSVFFSAYSAFFSFIILTIISIYKTIKNQIVWKTIEKESVLIIITIACLITLGIVTNYIVKY